MHKTGGKALRCKQNDKISDRMKILLETVFKTCQQWTYALTFQNFGKTLNNCSFAVKPKVKTKPNVETFDGAFQWRKEFRGKIAAIGDAWIKRSRS